MSKMSMLRHDSVLYADWMRLSEGPGRLTGKRGVGRCRVDKATGRIHRAMSHCGVPCSLWQMHCVYPPYP